MNHSTSATLRLPVSRHLQDFNGYCGPACALMVVEFTGSAKSPPVFAQNEFFKEVRSHAKANKDRRPVKSPAESLLNMLNDHTAGDMEWVKTFNSETTPVAQEIIRALDQKQQPCLMLVSKGMHWVVAFGLQRKDDGTPAGLLMRDPAWAGMPKFYGLSIFPDEPAIKHSQSPCPCLDHTDNPPGAVHERYITMHELISGRGLQGSPDWEGDGAIALVPNGVATAAILPGNVAAAGFGAAPFLPAANPLENAGQAALDAVRENGLYGRPDSPADWNAALKGATAGEPILVKDPENSKDDFYLVPLIPSDPKAKHGAWAMMDAKTLALREVSLLENWQAPAFPSDTSGDAEKASKQQHTLQDGTKARFNKNDLKPNTNNLVWAASAACVLPYWPVKELTAPHPVTGEPVSIYVNQEGEIFNHLLPDHIQPPEKPSKPKPKPKSGIGKVLKIGGGLCILALGTFYLLNKQDEKTNPSPDPTLAKILILETFENSGTELNGSLTDTRQTWSASTALIQRRGKLRIQGGKTGNVKFADLKLKPNSIYRLSMDVNVTKDRTNDYGFGFGFRKSNYYDLVDGSVGAMLHKHIPKVELFSEDYNNKQIINAKTGLQSLTIILTTGDALKNSTLSWEVDGKKVGKSQNASAADIDGVFFSTARNSGGLIDNFKLTEDPN